MHRFLLLALAWTAVLTLVPAAASPAVAGRSSLDYDTLVYSADAGEQNRLTVSREAGRVVFDDSGAAITPGRGCTTVTASRVSCEAARYFTSVDLEDGDDEATISGDLGDLPMVFFGGGPGNDTLRGTAQPNALNGGPGEDVLEGGTGTSSINATFTLGGGSSQEMPEVVPERDTVTCAAPADASQPRTTSVDESDVLSGDCGQVQTYTADAVVARGTEGADILSGNFYPTRLHGLGGDDRLFGTGSTNNRMDGGAGNDTIESGGLLLGGEGDDRLSSGIANEVTVRQDGGPGNDLLLGRYGNDRLVGGPGRDRLSGGAGNDYIRARDRERDSVRCGTGRSDRVVADRADSVARDCERVSRR